jgi:RNA polymerase sigma-32 factor
MAEDPPTLQALGVRLGVSKERVRQIEERAMTKLKEKLAQRNDASRLTPAA